MINFQKKTLSNGLTILAHQDTNSCMAAVNVLYKVGARNEDPNLTGMAHLFEHLMFSGSLNVPDFDAPLQTAGGENNAFTNNDYTNYYIALPAANIQTALWVESDRMRSLAINSESLEVQRKVVCEEFRQRYLNEPYGDLWSLFRPVCYGTEHPYSWPTIGLSIEHIERVKLTDVQAFFDHFYSPSNAILSITSPIECGDIIEMGQQWFGDIEDKAAGGVARVSFPDRPQCGRLVVERDVPSSVIYVCFPIGGRRSAQSMVLDVASDILSEGSSSRLIQRLVKERQLFSSVNAYITGEEGPGMFVATGRVMDGVSIEEAESALWSELRLLGSEPVSDYELEKVRNKAKANDYFSRINILNKAMNLAYYEFLGSADWVNTQVEEHHSIGKDDIMHMASKLFCEDSAYVLHYLKSNKE